MENKQIAFTILGTPRGKGRPRTGIIGGHARIFTDAKTRKAEESFLAQALPHKPDTPLDHPLQVTMSFFFVPPKSWSKKKRQQALDGEIQPTGKPDLDNCLKLVDALNGVFWKDDAQITEIRALKRYDETPRTVVFIRWKEDAVAQFGGAQTQEENWW